MESNAFSALHNWLMELGNEGRAQKTVEAYDADVTDTLNWIASFRGVEPSDLHLTDITREDLVAAISDFRTRPDPRYSRHPDQAPKERSAARVSRRMAAIKVFLKWCYETGKIPSDPGALIKSPKRAKRLPKALEADTAMLVMTNNEDSRWPERDNLVIVLALTTGLRLQEIATLKLTDLIGSPPNAINVIGKGNKERRLPLPPVTQEALQAYLPTRAKRLSKTGMQARTVFISTRARRVGTDKQGEVIMTVEATNAGIAYIVDRILRLSGARRRGSRVHVLRHTFATLGLRPDPATGQPAYTLRQLQAALGHANLATIQVYTEVSDSELVEAAAAHPLARAK
ncbi:MAG TPA: tyrosine-type recombinase/integrase [Actinomycetota bacterium]|nr:tyrosine-type recombinase/integrase [Actinomycetota bacterium]